MASITDEQMMRVLEQIAEIAKNQNEADDAINDVAGVVKMCLERILQLEERLAKLEGRSDL